ncbi:hypothetical protein OKW41_006303 [Paraburkholderia sp. UCT70]
MNVTYLAKLELNLGVGPRQVLSKLKMAFDSDSAEDRSLLLTVNYAKRPAGCRHKLHTIYAASGRDWSLGFASDRGAFPNCCAL